MRNKAVCFLALCCVCWAADELGCETFDIQTHYPSPAGIYENLTATGDTVLARDGGNVGIGTGANAPTARLDIVGSVRFRTGAVAGKVLVSDANGFAAWGDITYTP